MAKGNGIIVSSNPRGKFLEGTITGALTPGILLQIDVSEGIDTNGNFTWEPFTFGDGIRGLIAILLPNELSGGLATTAYATGDHGFVYVPAMGEEFNMVLQDVAGTGDDHAFGAVLMADSGTGKLIATTGVIEAEPFQLLEIITDPVADTLAHCIYTGY